MPVNGVPWPPPTLMRAAAATSNGVGLFLLSMSESWHYPLGIAFVALSFILQVADTVTSRYANGSPATPTGKGGPPPAGA